MHRAIPAALLVALALLLAACAGARSGASVATGASEVSSSALAAESHGEEADDKAEGGDDDYTEGRDYSTDAPSDDGAAASDDATVTLTGFQFDTSELTVAAGTEVTFVNEDTAAHTVTEGEEGVAADGARFDEEIAGGATIEVTFDEPGTYNVTCLIHPTMNMTITVEG